MSEPDTKSGRGICSMHYIRDDVLRELVLEHIRAVNEYIWEDAEGFQEDWLRCRRTDWDKSIREDRKRLEQAKKRLTDFDAIISQIYEVHVLGNLSLERYKKMLADYEVEQERMKPEIEVIGKQVEQCEEEDDNLDRFMELCRKYVDVPELTQTIVNECIRKIVVYAPDKSGGKRQWKIVIHFHFVDEVEVPALSEPIIAETTYGRRKTA